MKQNRDYFTQPVQGSRTQPDYGRTQIGRSPRMPPGAAMLLAIVLAMVVWCTVFVVFGPDRF